MSSQTIYFLPNCVKSFVIQKFVLKLGRKPQKGDYWGAVTFRQEGVLASPASCMACALVLPHSTDHYRLVWHWPDLCHDILLAAVWAHLHSEKDVQLTRNSGSLWDFSYDEQAACTKYDTTPCNLVRWETPNFTFQLGATLLLLYCSTNSKYTI